MENFEQEETKSWTGPLKIIGALFLILIILFMSFPSSKIKLDPEPKYIPSINEVIEKITLDNKTYSLRTREDFNNFVNPRDPLIRRIATKIVTSSGCESNKPCQAKAVYYFVRDNVKYVSDPVNFEYVEDPKEVLYTQGADCESGTLLLAALLESIGFNAELVFVTNHAFLRVDVKDASQRYKKDGWVYMDWTCKTCEFGKIPNNYKEMDFLDVG